LTVPARRRRRYLSLVTAIVVAITGTAVVPTVRGAAVVHDVAIYGATPAGVLAAVTAARAGARVILVEPSAHVGGMMTSGLGWTDIGAASTLGGYTKEFFDRLQAAQGTSYGRYHHEPHVAEDVFRAMLAEQRHRITLWRNDRLLETGGLLRSGTAITTMRLASGRSVLAKVFIDASYEADLMAQAGVTYRVGREAGSAYGESLAGVRAAGFVLRLPHGVEFPYLSPPPGPTGSADSRIQESNYRVCFSSNPANRVAFTKPPGYAESDYDLTLAFIDARQKSTGATPVPSWILVISALANQKFDVNASGVVTPALPGLNWSYPEGSYAERAEIATLHRRYQQGLFWFLQNDPDVPATIRNPMAAYGLCKDEFTDNGNWPWVFYLREGRRMVGTYVMRQRDIESQRSKRDSIGLASYRVDSHYVSRWIDDDGDLFVEGTIALPYITYAVPYRALTPRRGEVDNLLVPVALSATHVAYSSLRMEPQYMLFGEAAGQAAAQAARMPIPIVQQVDVRQLQVDLEAHGSVLDLPSLASPLLARQGIRPEQISRAG
jgi:hypothetical protein